MRSLSTWLLSCSLLLAAPTSAQNAIWESAGGPASGSTSALAASPSGVYVISSPDLYRSQDDGRSWNRIETPLEEMVGMSVSSSGVLAIRTSIFCTLTDSCDQEGVYISGDDGASWAPIVLPEPEALVWDLAGGSGTRIFATSFPDPSLYYTDDAGASWTQALEGVDSTGEILATSNGFVVVPARVVATSEHVLHVSSDNGASWNVQSVPDEVATYGFASRLALSSTGALLSYAGDHLYRSDDGGASWQTLSFPATCTATPYCRPGEVAFDPVEGIWASFSAPSQSYTASIFHTTDGDEWEETTIPDLSALSLHLAPGVRLASTRRGIFRYEEGDWHPSNEGLLSSSIQDLHLGPDGALYSASFEGDWSRLDPDSDEWAPLPFLRIPQAVLPDQSGSTVWAGTIGTPGLWRLSADRSEWEPVGLRNVRGLHQTEAGTLLCRVVASGPPYIARSTDGGATWEEEYPLDALDFLERDGIVYASSRDGVYQSTDDGQSWSSIGLDGATVGRLAEADGTLWATSSGQLFRRGAGQAEWQEAWSAPEGTSLRDVLAAPGAVYLATRDTVHRSTDDGATWEAWTSGLPGDASLRALTLGPGGHLYVGTWSRSVYRTVEPLATSSDMPAVAQAFLLGRPYPNPAVGHADLALDIPDHARVRVGVYDLLGREVAVVLDRALTPGQHMVRVLTQHLSAGVYIVQARMEGRIPRAAQQRLVVTR